MTTVRVSCRKSLGAYSKGRFNSASLAEYWCEGSGRSKPRDSVLGNNPLLTLERQLAATARRLNAGAESPQGATYINRKGLIHEKKQLCYEL